MKKIVSIAMVQPLPLPGSFRNGGQGIEEITQKVLEETRMLDEAGFDAVILQNMGDMPVKQHSRPEAITYLSVIAKEIKRTFSDMALGILVNWDGVASLAVAEASGADFIRVEHVYTGVEVTSAGLIQAQCCEITEMRKRLQSKLPVLADVYEPHGVPLGAKTLENAAWESVHEAFADGLFLSGNSPEESIRMLSQARKRVPDTPIFLGGGATGDNVAQLLQHFEGVCVATWIKNGNMKNPVDQEKAKLFIEQVEYAKSQRRDV